MKINHLLQSANIACKQIGDMAGDVSGENLKSVKT
jgi:NAD-specific glutamate dehydrogenase